MEEKKLEINIKKLVKEAIIPKYQTKGSAGFDFHSVEDITILAGQIMLIKTGISVEIPESYEMQIRPRSGLALKHGISVWNSPGTIDSDYRGEIGIILVNAGKNFSIRKGDRIAQGVINKVEICQFIIAEDLSETVRGEGGFGSTSNLV
jgi:dUTP pyrophosphatase